MDRRVLRAGAGRPNIPTPGRVKWWVEGVPARNWRKKGQVNRQGCRGGGLAKERKSKKESPLPQYSQFREGGKCEDQLRRWDKWDMAGSEGK